MRRSHRSLGTASQQKMVREFFRTDTGDAKGSPVLFLSKGALVFYPAVV